ncbi:MAG: asparagine synthetase B [Gemmatimonadales bacterium]|nr:MAG: asparagine synthetase B [Gemmatimonadales bacterium]
MSVLGGGAGALAAQHLLVPMDRDQANHLRAYGLTYHVIDGGLEAEWLLNYRGGSFLLPDTEGVRREAALRGVSVTPIEGGELARIRARIQNENMEAVPLETAPRVAIYTPPNTPPWDDAVTLALEYADIPYETVWDGEVLEGRLNDFDWLHLHHEDFTGQYSKFFLTYAGTGWLQDEVRRNEEMARRFGHPDVPELKRAVAERIRSFVVEGGFLFAMCSATETLDLALASHSVDITASYANGRSPDPDASERMDWDRALAFQGADIQTSASINAFSDIDSHQVNTPWREPLGAFTLFEFSAKIDPIPSMLVQNHESVISDFYGLTTAFRADRLKPGATILAREGNRVKYLTGMAGEGSWTFYGGHDPEDPEHQIGDAPTNLDLHPNSPGYRLILNNILFPAAKPTPLKT